MAIVFGTPLLLGVVELWHPAVRPGDKIVPMIAPIAVWWTTLHVLQVPLFALLGIAVLYIVGDATGRASSVSRAAIYAFIVLYPAFDAAVGISSGVMLQHIPASQQAAFEPALQALFWGPVTGMMAIIASACWLIGVVAAAFAQRRLGAPALAVTFLVLSGLLLGFSHIRPFGPLACLCFLVGAAIIERRGVVPMRPATA